ncbi:MAG: hypothetical protein MUF13_08870 [Akkermansiaceae bacterium]|nr:hypothetical protein [Akkermansiaceae bacterium]
MVLAVSTALIGCASSHFGKRYDVKEYGGLSGDITEGFSTIRASVRESNITDPASAELRTRYGRNLIVRWDQELPPIRSLDPEKVYTFDLIAVKGVKKRFSHASVYRVKDDEDTVADLSKCARHRRQMHREVEDWIDGYDFTQGRVRAYPNSGIFHSVCGSGIRHVVWVCETCRLAEQKQIDRLSANR